MDRKVLQDILDRSPVNDDGRSGAVLERVSLADGSRVVVKHFDPTVDLVMRLSGDPTGREVEVVRRGVLDGLPPTLLHPVIAASTMTPCGWVCSPGSPGWAGTRRSTSSSTPIRPSASVNGALPWWLRQAERALETGLV